MPIKQTALAKHWGVTRERVSQLVKQGCPLNSVRAADLWRKSRGQKRAPTNSTHAANLQQSGAKRGRPKNPRKPSNTGDSLLDALRNSIAVAKAAYEDFELARTDPASRSARLSEHNKAVQAQMAAERAYREEQERRRILVPKQETIELVRRTMEAILRPLKKLPSETGPQCSKVDALMAVAILERKVAEIMAAARKALANF